MSNMSNKDLIMVSIKNLNKLLENDDVNVWPKTLKVISSTLNQRADQIETNLELDEQVYTFN